MKSHWETRTCGGGGLVAGVALLSLGVIFLLTNLGLLQSQLFRTWWPLLLIAFGFARLLRAGGGMRPRRRPYSDFDSF